MDIYGEAHLAGINRSWLGKGEELVLPEKDLTAKGIFKSSGASSPLSAWNDQCRELSGRVQLVASASEKMTSVWKGFAPTRSEEDSTAAGDVYIREFHINGPTSPTRGVVIKPGEDNWRFGQTCDKVLAALGLESTIPAVQRVVLPAVVSRSDIRDGRPVEYLRAQGVNDTELLVDVDETKEFSIGEDGELLVNDSQDTWSVDDAYSDDEFSDDEARIQSDGTEEVFKPIPGKPGQYISAGKEVMIRVKTVDTGFDDEIFENEYLVPADRQFELIARNGKDYVERNGQLYEVSQMADAEGSYKVVGKNIEAAAIERVDNLFTGFSKKKSAAALTLTDAGSGRSDRERFFNRLDRKAFAQTFLASLIVRPGDGKISSLDESNYLVTILPNDKGSVNPTDDKCPLALVMIDLDDTLPETNNTRKSPTDKDMSAIRCGLMGFDLVREPLEKDVRSEVVRTLQDLVSKKSELSNDVKVGVKSDARARAFEQMVDRVSGFLSTTNDQEFTLEELWFAVFPDYKDTWEKMTGATGPIQKAEMIGAEDTDVILKRWG